MVEIKRVYTASPLGLVPDFFGSQETNTFKNPYNTDSSFVNSIFSSGHKILKRSEGKLSDPLTFGEPSVLHIDKVYDVSTTNILEVLSKPGYERMRLKSSDFIYAQDYGVYPNNRLIVCRRFPGPCGDDLTRPSPGGKIITPTCTLISWFGDEESPIDFDFGEKWKDSSESLKDILNDFGKDITVKALESSGLGGRLAVLGNAIPLPGVTEVLQRRILQGLGIIGTNASKLPAGDPNLIMESSQRQLVGMDSVGSGLTGKIKVKVTCKWEQKFIAGVDPTFVYYDILRTILSFGGSNATFYLGGSKLASGVNDFLDKLATNPFGLIESFISEIQEALKNFIEKIKDWVRGSKVKDESQNTQGSQGTEEVVPQYITEGLEKLGNAFGSGFEDILKFVTYKYKIKIMGVMNYLTGSPSGPWHITIGNPMRPILSSGDMITSEVNVKLGPTLSFNDLPSTIECTFTLISARNLGIGEIFGKLSCGQVRVTKDNPNKGKQIGDLKDKDGNPELERSTIDVLSSLDDPSFYNSDEEFLSGQGIRLSEIGEIDIAESPEGAQGAEPSQGSETKVVDIGQGGPTTTPQSSTQRGGFEVGGQNYDYILENNGTVTKITVSQLGRSVFVSDSYENSSHDPQLQSVEDFVIEVAKGEVQNNLA